jgi:hypothetical protein
LKNQPRFDKLFYAPESRIDYPGGVALHHREITDGANSAEPGNRTRTRQPKRHLKPKVKFYIFMGVSSPEVVLRLYGNGRVVFAAIGGGRNMTEVLRGIIVAIFSACNPAGFLYGVKKGCTNCGEIFPVNLIGGG